MTDRGEGVGYKGDIDKVLPVKLIAMLLDPRSWKDPDLDPERERKMKRRCSRRAKAIYAEVHQKPLLFRNFYEFVMMAFIRGQNEQATTLLNLLTQVS